ncbi:hypothetical protein CONPUDRAFT_142393 [Coniophora puteana RWD-64-598 SS2]|uniref:Transmembrane protein n=1 Tax=Coniophora puteana (strain RWD-64-598) TaxID=741705 RepID=A0A5M3MXW5_CONPW|nr:uncharacterized protein CONPUDRAFT_142393 [Coniophora puteana RWD-64-598 SS2]EIW83857.1 hypothetical protein CONPUDRAFT_142393 [Coniophora puteana RWD-64-598 SS2]
MSDNSVTIAVETAQTFDFALLATSVLSVYRFLLNLDQEIDLVWKGKNSKSSMTLYGILTYGGILQAIFVSLPMLGNNKLSQNVSLANVSMSMAILPAVLTFGLSAMMTSRVYAMYGRSRRVLVFLGTCFATTQTLNIVATVVLLVTMGVTVAEESPGVCYFTFPLYADWLVIASAIAICANEVMLLFMVVYSMIVSLRDGLSGPLWSLNTLLSIVARDHVFYFLIASLNWIVQMISYFPMRSVSLATFLLWVVFTNAISIFGNCMLGPIMFLSIRRFDAKQAEHGEPWTVEMDGIQFAVVEGRSQCTGERSASTFTAV